jgi:hypothetical protein
VSKEQPNKAADSVRRSCVKIQLKIAGACQQLRDLQTLCPHPRVEKIARADTGNWCKSDDSYWYDCKCPDCDKQWTEDR